MASTQSINSGVEVHEPKVQEDSDPKNSSPEVSDLEAGRVDAKSEPKNDINEISWDSDDDASNPRNWSASRKWQNLGVISIMALTTSVSTSSLDAPFNGRPHS